MMQQTDQVGHTAKALLFDDATVLIPFTQRELNIVTEALRTHINLLKTTRDFPEQGEYVRVHNNLRNAGFLVSSTNV